MIQDAKLRDDMMFLLGQIEAVQYPFIWEPGTTNAAYYDLLESIRGQYVRILQRTIGYQE